MERCGVERNAPGTPTLVRDTPASLLPSFSTMAGGTSRDRPTCRSRLFSFLIMCMATIGPRRSGEWRGGPLYPVPDIVLPKALALNEPMARQGGGKRPIKAGGRAAYFWYRT